jgi:hypothetical protein
LDRFRLLKDAPRAIPDSRSPVDGGRVLIVQQTAGEGGPGAAPGRLGIGSTVRLWLVFLAFAVAAALLIAALQRAGTVARPEHVSSATARPPAVTVAFAPTFAEAAQALRLGRHAEAYGRFVTLADEGDIDAGRIALLLHRFGPKLFGSHWDATTEQLQAWTTWSEEANRRDLALALPPPRRADVALAR